MTSSSDAVDFGLESTDFVVARVDFVLALGHAVCSYVSLVLPAMRFGVETEPIRAELAGSVGACLATLGLSESIVFATPQASARSPNLVF